MPEATLKEFIFRGAKKNHVGRSCPAHRYLSVSKFPRPSSHIHFTIISNHPVLSLPKIPNADPSLESASKSGDVLLFKDRLVASVSFLVSHLTFQHRLTASASGSPITLSSCVIPALAQSVINNHHSICNSLPFGRK